MSNIEHDFSAFEGRKGRYFFVKKKFPGLLESSSSILDVGCDENYLKEEYGQKVFGVDIGGSPDRQVDLEKESLRFLSANSYELVLCMEVLEHLDNLHEVFDDLLRVSSRYVLISLPNSSSAHRLWRTIRHETNGKFYGLPFEKPTDRHKWFMSYKEIIAFMERAAATHSLVIRRIMLHYNVLYENKGLLKRLKQEILKTWIHIFNWKNYSQEVFVLFEKSS